MFDFERFTTAAKLAYRRVDGSAYSFDDVLHVFRFYFLTYELVMETAHPAISIAQIARIIEKMPYLLIKDDDPPADNPPYEGGGNDDEARWIDLSPEEYELMIDQHFVTNYARCDYNINHFFSGKIRDNRYYETCV